MKLALLISTLVIIVMGFWLWHDHSTLTQRNTYDNQEVYKLMTSKENLAVDDAQECQIIMRLDSEIEKAQSGYPTNLLLTSNQLGVQIDSSSCTSHATSF